jgi:hypothetical protein
LLLFAVGFYLFNSISVLFGLGAMALGLGGFVFGIIGSWWHNR